VLGVSQVVFDLETYRSRNGANISRCGLFRYLLIRQWGPLSERKPRYLAFLMLNPSTADAEKDDPTIRRCIGFAKSLGYDGIIVVNLFAYRATIPEALKEAVDPIGPDNDLFIAAVAQCGAEIICAWGTPLAEEPEHKARVKHVFALIAKSQRSPEPLVYCLETSKGGHPRHPLMLKKDLKPFPFKVGMEEA
jgi:hypothetical protein